MKYASFKYGGGSLGAKYGTGLAIEQLTWYFGVFWDDAFIDESPIMIDLQTDRGRDHLLSSGGAWERYRAGEASGTFDNSDGRFDPYNVSGPLYGFLLPGRLVRITVEVLPPYADTPTTYDVIRGHIDDIQTGSNDGQREATIKVKDGLEWLTRRSTALELVSDGEALVTAAALAEAVGFDDIDDWSIVQLGADSVVVPSAEGVSDNTLAFITEFVDAEAGQVFHAKDGTLTMVTNDYTEREVTDIDAPEILRDFQLLQPWEVVRTRAKITATPRVTGPNAVVWSFGVDDNGVTNTPVIILPAPFGDVDVNLGFFVSGTPTIDFYARDTGGADQTGNVIATMPLNYYIHLNSVTAVEVRVTWIEVSVTGPLIAGDPVILTSEDLPGIVIYGEKTFTLDNEWIQDTTYGQAYADWVVAQLKDARLFPTIQIENRGTLQFSPELYISKIHLTVPAFGIDDTFRVGKISHRWLNQNGLAVRSTFRLEPVLGAL